MFDFYTDVYWCRSISVYLRIHHRQVAYRAHSFGAGDLPRAVALLVAHFRHSSWAAGTFYTQLFVIAFMCMCQEGADTRLWKNFIVGRVCHVTHESVPFNVLTYHSLSTQLPKVLLAFSEILKSDNSSATADLVSETICYLRTYTRHTQG
jgi:hypothetical protein